MTCLIAVPASDLKKVLLASISSLVLAKLLFSTDNSMNSYSLEFVFQPGFFLFSFLFLPLFFGSFLTYLRSLISPIWGSLPKPTRLWPLIS